MTLHTFQKTNTSNEVFQKHFLELMKTYEEDNWTAIYTDGSKATNTAFALTKTNGEFIKGGILPCYSSVFTAEAFAVSKALECAIHNKGKFCNMLDRYVQEIGHTEGKHFDHRYSTFNPTRTKVVYPREISRAQATIFTRLRIGHTQLTHQHLLTGKAKPSPYPFCTSTLSLHHIFNLCSALASIRQKHNCFPNY